MIARFWFLLGVMLALIAPALSAQHAAFEKAQPIFNDTVLPEIRITVAPEDLDQIWANVYSDHEYPATFHFDNGIIQETVENVGFRLRGNTSRTSKKKSFKVSFNTFEKGRKFYGLEKLNLNGEHNDPSIIRSKLAWDAFQELGIKATRANHIKLYVNDAYYGLYINVEHIDEQFVQSRWRQTGGNLYKCLWPADLVYMGPNPDIYRSTLNGRRTYDLKTNTDADDYTNLIRLIEVVNLTSFNDFPEAIDDIFDVNGYLKILALEVATGGWDGYWFLKNNYYLYDNPETGKFEFIPYDYDNTFGVDFIGLDIGKRDVLNWGHPSEPRPLTTRLLAVPEFRDRYTFFLNHVIQTALKETHIYPEIDRLKTMITEAAEADPFRTRDYGFTITDFHNSYENNLVIYRSSHVQYGIKPFINTRNSSLQYSLIPLPDIAPILSSVTHTPHRPTTQTTMIFTAQVTDETTNLDVALRYKINDGPMLQVALFDDGLHGDGAAGDQLYGAQLETPADPATLQWMISATDPNNQTGYAPFQRTESRFYNVQTHAPTETTIFINEFMASNDQTVQDDAGDADDWIELYNDTDETINLSDYFLTDNLSNPDKWAFPDTTIAAKGHLLIWADDDTDQGPLHMPYKLSKGGEQIGIFRADGEDFAPVDTLTFGEQETDISFGRSPDGAATWTTFDLATATPPTPGSANHEVSTSTELPAIHQPALHPAYPNPFQQQTTVSFTLPQAAELAVTVYNVLGAQVATLASGIWPSGTHHVSWSGTDTNGQQLASGIYLVHARTPDAILPVQKIVLVR